MDTIYDVGEIKKLVAAKIKKEFPKYGFSLRIRRGGSGVIYINWYKADFYPFTEADVTDVNINHYYIQDDKRITQKAKDVIQRVYDITEEYNWDRSDPMTDYFNVNFYLHLYVGTYDKPFEVVASKSKSSVKSPSTASSTTSTTPSSSEPSAFDKGQLLRSEAGWKAYVKQLPDGRIVYNVYKDKETAANKTDWNVIKGEVYVESGFKWSKYGFARWGSLTPNDENLLLDFLFKVLSKYYQSATEPTQQDSNNDNVIETKFVYGKNYGISDKAGMYVVNLLRSKGFKVNVYGGSFIGINKPNYDDVIVSDIDFTGEFLIYKSGGGEDIGRFDYIIQPPSSLADKIEETYDAKIVNVGTNSISDKEREEVQEAITALQYLADLGDDEAKTAITALKYLL